MNLQFETIKNKLMLINEKYYEKIEDKLLLNKLIILTFFGGIFLIGLYLVNLRIFKYGSFFLHNDYIPLIFIFIPAVLAVLLYARFARVSMIGLILLFIWGIVALMAGMFIGFFATMDIFADRGIEPFLMGSFGKYEFIMWEFVIYIIKYLLYCVIISSVYVIHAKFKVNRIASLLILILLFPAIPFFISFGGYWLAVEFGI